MKENGRFVYRKKIVSKIKLLESGTRMSTK